MIFTELFVFALVQSIGLLVAIPERKHFDVFIKNLMSDSFKHDDTAVQIKPISLPTHLTLFDYYLASQIHEAVSTATDPKQLLIRSMSEG